MAGIQTSKVVPWPGTEETLTLRGWRAPVGDWRRRDRRAGARRGPRRTRRPQRRRARRARASAAPSADPGGRDSPLRRSPARAAGARLAAAPSGLSDLTQTLSSMKVVSRRKGEVHEAGDHSQDVAEVVRDPPRTCGSPPTSRSRPAVPGTQALRFAASVAPHRSLPVPATREPCCRHDVQRYRSQDRGPTDRRRRALRRPASGARSSLR